MFIRQTFAAAWARVALAIAVAASLTACAAGTGTSALPYAHPNAGMSSMARGQARATVRITIPRIRHRRGRVGPRYVSPSTQGITLSIAGPTVVHKVAGLTPTSTGCSSTLAGTTCTLAINGLQACPPTTSCYTATIATYDAVTCNPACSIPVSAHALSAAQNVSFHVDTGQNNLVGVTLGGIPAALAVTPLTPGYIQGDAHALELWGPQAQKIVVNALDADGNAIVGPGAPVISASPSAATLTVAQASFAKPNIVTIAGATSGSPAIVTPGKAILRVTVTPASQSGAAPFSKDVPVTIAHRAVYVGLSTNVVNVYYDSNTSTPSRTISGANTGLSVINQLWVDQYGTLYVTNGGASEGSVTEYADGTTGNVVPNVTIAGGATAMNSAFGFAIGSDGTLYVGQNASNAVTEYGIGASGNVAPIRIIIGANTGIHTPSCITLDANQTLYVANYTGASITEYASGASGNAIPSATIAGASTGFVNPSCPAFDANGSLLVSDVGNNSIFTFAGGASGNATPLATIAGAATQLNAPYVIALDAAGTIYAANNSAVTEYASGSNGNVAPIATIPSTPEAYAVYAVPPMPSP